MPLKNTWTDYGGQINNKGQVVISGEKGLYLVNPISPTQITDNNGYFDVAPQVLDDGRIVWQGWDGHDYEIYSPDAGAGHHPAHQQRQRGCHAPDECHGHLVWMNWDGSNWQVWYNLGNGPVQLTHGNGFNVLPQITGDVGGGTVASFGRAGTGTITRFTLMPVGLLFN